MDEQEIRPECRDRFERIENRLNDGEKLFSKHGERLTAAETSIDNVAKSLDGVTKALWGVAASIGGMLFMFLLWYIESKH